MQSKGHWEQVYTTKTVTSVSSFQEHARQSSQLIQQTGVTTDAGIIDVGAVHDVVATSLGGTCFCYCLMAFEIAEYECVGMCRLLASQRRPS